MANERTIEVRDELWRQVKAATAIDGMTIKEWFDRLLVETFERRKQCKK